VSSREQAKADARARREATERDAAAAAARRQRLRLLGGVAAVAVVIVAVIVAVSSGGGAKHPTAASTTGAVKGKAQVATLLRGIPQQGTTLGRSDAPVTLVEYADLKCPICQQYSLATQPTIIKRYVRTGKLRILFRPQTFVGSPPGDSKRAAAFALAAAKQNRFWNFTELFYVNQQNENTGYATDGYLKRIGGAVPGLDVQSALAGRSAAGVARALTEASTAFDAAGFTGTPSFELGRSGSQLRPYNLTSYDPAKLGAAIDKLLKS
jgi:protein-disulfide isomerase